MLATKKRIAVAVLAAAAIVIAAGALNPGILRRIRQEAVISVAGDLLLDRGVAEAISQNGAAYPYEGVAPLFRRDDLTIANLECPLTDADSGALKSKRFVFKADPANAAVLKSSGFDALLLANNHTMDYLSQGLSDTMAALDDANLHHSGAGETAAEIKPCFIDKNGVRIGILSYSALPPEGFVYDDGSATVAYARAGFLDDMQREISDAAAQCDFLLVCFHWGTEFRHDVNDSQIETAHAAVDAGADAVIGTHPHVLQGRETYKGALIYYSLGNFVFDKQIPEGTSDALIVQLTVNKNGIVSINELPVLIENCQPRLTEGEQAENIVSDLVRYSRRFE
jgi:poly-gamma-glutamate synthesis protein (capsule biosynthesis protein)